MPVSTEAKKAFAGKLLERLSKIPPVDRDWYEVLLTAALDETGGSLEESIPLADAIYAEHPHAEE